MSNRGYMSHPRDRDRNNDRKGGGRYNNDRHHRDNRGGKKGERKGKGKGKEEEIVEYELPYNVVERLPLEHFSRHLHRLTTMPLDMVGVSCHWADIPTGEYIQSIKERTPSRIDTTSPHANYKPPVEGGETVDVRALLVCRYQDAKHVLKSFDLVVCKNLSVPEKPVIQAYGGGLKCDVADDAAMKSGLSELVEMQSGMVFDEANWVKFVEFRHKNKPPVVFFTPRTVQHPPLTPRPSSIITKQTDEDQEEILEHADASKLPRSIKIQPTTVPLSNLVDHKITGIPHETAMTALAADALNEYLRREMAVKAKQYVEEYVVRKRAVDVENSRKRERKTELKRVKTETQEARKKARLDEDEINRVEVEKLGYGYTLDEKQEIAKAKGVVVKEERRVIDAELDSKYKIDCEAVDTEGGKFEVVHETDHEIFDTFQFFDKPKPGREQATQLQKTKLCNIFLSLPTATSTAPVMSLLNEASQHPFVSYRTISTVRKRIPINEAKKEEAAPKPSEDEPMEA